MHNKDQDQRLNCMMLSGLILDQRAYIRDYRGSMVNVAINRPVEFPTLAKFRDNPDSPELQKELKNVFGFSNFGNPDWLCHTRAQNDIEEFARRPTANSLWGRLKTAVSFGVDP